MTTDNAGRIQETWNIKYGEKACLHSRIVGRLESKRKRNPAFVVCHECGVIFPDPHQQVGLGKLPR